MTMIAGYQKDNLPVILGDLLVFKDRLPEHEDILVPGVGKPLDSRDGYLEWVAPVGLAQKVIVVTKCFAFAWTGREIMASTFISYLDKIDVPTVDASTEVWRNFLNLLELFFEEESRTKVGADFACIFMVCADHFRNIFSYNIPPKEVESCDVFFAGGFGEEWAAHAVSGKQVSLEGNYDEGSGGTSLICTLASLWARDSIDQTNISSAAFGGGYEAVTLTSGGLEKVGDILLANAQIIQHSKTEYNMNLSLKIAKVDYLNNFMAIRTRDHFVGPADTADRMYGIPIADADLRMINFLVAPPGSDASIDVFNPSDLPDMNAHWLGFHVDVFLQSGEVTEFQFAFSDENRKLPIWFEDEYFFISPKVQESIHKGYMAIIGEMTN